MRIHLFTQHYQENNFALCIKYRLLPTSQIRHKTCLKSPNYDLWCLKEKMSIIQKKRMTREEIEPPTQPASSLHHQLQGGRDRYLSRGRGIYQIFYSNLIGPRMSSSQLLITGALSSIEGMCPPFNKISFFGSRSKL